MAGTASDHVPVPAAPFDTPTKRYSAFLQEQWRIVPSLTVNLGVRWDTESYYGQDPIIGHLQGVLAAGPVVASRRRDVGFRGRRHLEAVRFGGPLLLRPADGHQRPRVHRLLLRHDLQLRPCFNRPGSGGPAQRDLPGRRRLGLAGRSGYEGVLSGRADGRRREGSRPDSFHRPQGHLPDPRPHDRRSLRSRLQRSVDPRHRLRAHQPRLGRSGRERRDCLLQRLGQSA